MTATVATVAGNVVRFPDGTSYPSSTLNYAAGATRANNGVVGLGAVLRVRSNQSSGTVQLLLDVNGYFE